MSTTTEELLSIGEASLFFDQTASWLRWREDAGVFKDKNGNPIELTRRANGRKMGGGDRRYTYQNIKDMADALHREEIFNQAQRDLVHQRVEAFEQSIHESE